MKIIHVMDWYIPSMGYQENFFPAAQKKRGHEVQIITSDRVPSFRGYKNHMGKIIGNRIIGEGTFCENDIHIHRLSVIFEIKDGEILFLRGLVHKLKVLKPDIVQAHGTTSFSTLIVILLSKYFDYKVFVDDHSHSDNFRPTTFFKKVLVSFLKIFYRLFGDRVRCWMPVTYDAKAILETLYDIPSDKCEILHLGVNTNLFYKSDELRRVYRQRLQIPEETTLFISAGKFNEKKDIDLLIQVFAEIITDFPKIKLLLLGGGDDNYMAKIKSLANSLHLNDSIIFHNFVKNSELPAYYNAADIGIWPGAHSITAVEATATGLPIIVPEHNQAYRVLLDNNAAIGCRRRDSYHLKEQILLLLNNVDTRQMIQKNCIRTAREILSWEKVADLSIQIYNKY